MVQYQPTDEEREDQTDEATSLMSFSYLMTVSTQVLASSSRRITVARGIRVISLGQA